MASRNGVQRSLRTQSIFRHRTGSEAEWEVILFVTGSQFICAIAGGAAAPPAESADSVLSQTAAVQQLALANDAEPLEKVSANAAPNTSLHWRSCDQLRPALCCESTSCLCDVRDKNTEWWVCYDVIAVMSPHTAVLSVSFVLCVALR